MLVFLSWSGQKSKAVAEALKTWLAKVIQNIEPWISSDIEKGRRWSPEISEKLDKSIFGIICLTRGNLDARWLLFEAGALSKIKDANVCTFLLDVFPTDVKQPLSEFQHTTFQKEDIRKFVHDLNMATKRVGERGLEANMLNEVFDVYWPLLEKSLAEVGEMQEEYPQTVRKDRELLEEILGILRGSEHQENQISEKEVFLRAQMDYLVGLRTVLDVWVKLKGPQIAPFAKHAGVLRYMRFDTNQNTDVHDGGIAVSKKEGEWVVLLNNAKIAILDEMGQELEIHKISYGDTIKFPDGARVEVGEQLVEWDQYAFPILTPVSGTVAYGDIIDGVTTAEELDPVTGQFRRTVGRSDNMRPRISIYKIYKKNRNIARIPWNNNSARFLLPLGTRILVERGAEVTSGDVLGKIPLESISG